MGLVCRSFRGKKGKSKSMQSFILLGSVEVFEAYFVWVIISETGWRFN